MEVLIGFYRAVLELTIAVFGILVGNSRRGEFSPVLFRDELLCVFRYLANSGAFPLNGRNCTTRFAARAPTWR